MDNFSSLFGEDTLGGLGLDGLDTFGTSQPTATPVSVAEEPPSAFQPAPVSQGNYTSLGPPMQQLQSRKPGYGGPAAGFPGYGQPQPAGSASGAAAAGYQPYPTAGGPQPTPQQPVPYRQQQQQGYPAGYQYPGQPHMWPGQQHFTPTIASPYGHPQQQQQQAYHPGMAGYSPQHLAAMQRASAPAQSQLPYPGGYQPRPTAAAAPQQQPDAQQYAAARQQQMYAAYRGYPQQQQQAQMMAARSDQQHAAYPGFPQQQQQHYGAAPTPVAGYMTGQRMPRPGMASPQQQQPAPQQRLPGQQQQAVRMPSPQQQMSPQVRHPGQLTAAAANTAQRQPSPVAPPPSSLQHLEKMVMPAGRVLSPMAASSRSTPHSPSVVGPRTPTSPSSAAGWTQQLQRAPSPAPAAQMTAHQHHAVRMTSIDSMLHSMGPADGAAAAAAMRSDKETVSTGDANSSSQSSQHAAGFMEVRDACSAAGAAGYGEMMQQRSPHAVMLPPTGGYQPQQQHMSYGSVPAQQQQMTQMSASAQPSSLRPPQPHAAGWQHQQLQQQVQLQPLSVSAAPAAPHPPATSRATEQPARMFSPAPPPNQSDSIAIPDVGSPGSDDQQSASSPSAPLPSMRTPQLPTVGPSALSQISASHHRMSGGGLVGMQQQASMSHPAPVPAFSMTSVASIHHPAFMPSMRSLSHVAVSSASPLSSGMHTAASVSAAVYTSTPAPVSSISAPRSMLHSISSMVPSVAGGGPSSPAPSPPRMSAPAPYAGSPMASAFPSSHAAVSAAASGSPAVAPLHHPAILSQSGPRHFPNAPDSQQTDRTPSPRMSTGQSLAADVSVSPSTLVTSPVSSVSPSASSLASVHADHTMQSPHPGSVCGDSADARLQSHRPQQRFSCPTDGGPAFPPFSAAALVRSAAAPRLQSPAPPGSAVVRPGLSAAEESMPMSGGAADTPRSVVPSQSAHIQPHPGLPVSALSAPLPTSLQQPFMPPGCIQQQSVISMGSISMPTSSIHQQSAITTGSIQQQSVMPTGSIQQQSAMPTSSSIQQQSAMTTGSIQQQSAMPPVSVHQQSFVPPVSVHQQPAMPPASIQQPPSIPSGSMPQQSSMPPVPMQQQPSIPSGPMQQQPSIPSGPMQQQLSMPPVSMPQSSIPSGSIQQQPSIPPGPVQQQPSIPSGPSVPSGPMPQQPSIPSGPMQQQPSIPPGPVQQHPGLPHQSPRMSAPYPQSGFHPQLQYPAVGPGHMFAGPPHHAAAAMEQQRRGMQYELQQVQRQLQQLYSTPPTPQIQQSVQELQQRAQFLQMQLSVPPPTGHPGSFQGAPPPGYPAPGAPPGPLPPTQQSTVPSALADPSAGASVLAGDDPAAAPEDEPPAAGSGKRSRKKGTAKPRERKPPGEKKPRVRSRSKKAAAGGAEAAVDGAAVVPGVEAGEVLLQPGEVDPMATDLPRDDVDQVAKTPTDAKPKRVRPPRSRKKPLPKATAADEPTAGSETVGEEGEAEDGEATAVPDEAAADGETPGSAKKPAKPRVRTATPSRKKPKARLALNLFKKKKRRRGSESEPSDMEKTPPPSPPEDDALNASKRRSGRITGGRKKYVDDLDLRQLAQISDDETTSAGGRRDSHAADQTGAQSFAPNFAFINPNDEDSMIVQYILGQRKGKREVIPDDEPDESGAMAPAPVSTDVQAPVSADVPHHESTDLPAPVSTDVPAPLSADDPAVVPGSESADVPAEAPADVPAVAVVEASESAAAVHVAAVKSEGEDEAAAEVSGREEMDVSAREEMGVSGREEMDVSARQEMNVSGREDSVALLPGSGVETADRVSSESQLPSTQGMFDARVEPTTAGVDAVETPAPAAAEPPKTLAADGGRREAQFIEVDEFYVKYKNFSYLHCEWRTEEELLRGDKRVSAKIKRYEQKKRQSQNMLDFLEEELFNPDFVEVDRVLDVSEHTDPAAAAAGRVAPDKNRHFLVKWRSLSYEDCTWELEEDVDIPKIEAFFKYRHPPPKEQRAPKRRPKASDWTKMETSPVYKGNNQLREYQLEGVNWLTFSYYNGHNCILADEMGLGKTIQALTFTKAVFDCGVRGPFLVIAPLSTIPNWQREFEGWTDLNIIVYHGSAASRNMITEHEMYYKDPETGQQLPDVYKFHVLITTYEVIIQDCIELAEIGWRLCIIDEAHRLKNANCKLLEGLRLFDVEHRVLLSGTPLQNNIRELFSLLNFLEPTQFSSEDAFNREFGLLQTDEQVKKLQALLKPMMLRRLKEDVEKSLAPKEETIIEVELTNIQKKYYRGILEKNFAFLAKGSGGANLPNLMNTMMELRKCCIHPFLINGAEEQIQHERRQENKDQGNSPDTADEAYYQAMVQSAGKLVLVDKLLPKLRSQGHRVLVFSQMVRMLDILEDYLIYKQYPFERIDGRIRGDLRQAAIDRYSRPDSDRFVFLLCTKAGGLGINLTAADTVIIYDSDWNPQNDLQAQARCHRIGQRKMVKVYRLVTRNTYEREMFDRASLKLGLDKAVLQSMNTQQGDKNAAVLDGAVSQSNNKQLTKKEVEVLLKKGAYGALMDDDTDGQRFCEEDIDQILEKRTQVITFEEEKGSSFSKASFSTAGNRSDIDVDDPDFWNKWAKRAEIAQEDPLQNTLIVAEPRRRARIKRYGEETAPLNMSDIGTSSDSDEEAAQQQHHQQSASGKHDDPRGRRRRAPRYRADDDMDFITTDGSVGYGSWSRIECFKVERQLLVFGWGRWADIRLHGQLRDGWTDQLVEDLCRLMLLQCVRVYKGDDKIRSFVFDLICPENQGVDSVGKNHMGLNDPVPRGRKGKKKSRPSGSGTCDDVDWSRDRRYDTEQLLDRSYHRHLIRHANKLLLRVRMMYYVRTEIIGPLADRILDGASSSELNLHTPYLDQPPAVWWDSEADRALLMGTYKHGYERYVQMRQDPALCFLQRCGGPPSCDVTGSSSAPGVSAPNDPDTDTDMVDDDLDREETASSSAVASPAPSSDTASTPAPSTPSEPPAGVAAADGGAALLPFPSTVDLNTRLRRLVTAYQRTYKREEQKLQAQARRNERREKIEQIVREREMRKLELTQRRWSRQDEANFLRVLAAFGVEYRRKEGRYEWSRFRMLARLEKKLDDTLTDYYVEFRALCQQICTAAAGDSQPSANSTPAVQQMSTITELIPATQAAYLLDRLDLLNALRNEVVMHAELEDRLKLCEDAPNLPDWWTAGKHDRDLIIGAVRHGIGNSGFYILHDPDLSFRDVVTRHMKGLKLVDRKEKLKYAEWRQSRPAVAGNQRPVNNGVNGGALPNGHVDSEAAEGDATIRPSSPPPAGTPPGNTREADTLEAVHQEGADSVEVKCNGEVSSNGGTTTPTADIGQSTRTDNGDTSDVKRHSSGDQADDQQASVGDPGRKEDQESVSTEAKPDAVGEERTEDESTDLVKGAVKQDSVDEGRVKDDSSPTVDVKHEPVDGEMVSDKSPLPVDAAVKQVSNDDVAAPVKSEVNVKREVDSDSQKQEAVRLVNSASAQLFGTEESLGGRLSQLYDAEVLQELAMIQMLHQSYAAPIRWPSDHVLHQRLQHVLAAVRTGSWPPVDYQQLPADPLDPALVAGVATTAVGRAEDGAVTGSTTTRASTSRRVSSAAAAAAAAVYGQPSEQLMDDAATVATAGGERRGRKRAAVSSGIEVDPERTKLRALLNQNLQSITRHPSPQQTPRRTPTTTDTTETDSDGLAAVPPPSISPSQQQPPPAHQHLALRGAPPPGGIDLSFKTPQQQVPTAAPPASSPRATTPTAARADDVLDLSASLNSRSSTPQSERAAEDGVLDLHVSRTSSAAANPPTGPPSAGGRLDATPLDANRKRPSEEAGGKVKKRRKLDSIISGLSAAKTSSPVSSGDMTPSVSITPVPRRTAAPQPPPAHAAASTPRHDDAYPDITLSRAAQRRHDTPLLAAATASGPSPLPAHDMHKPDNKVYNWLETQHKASPSGSSARSRQRSDSSCSSAVSPSGRLSAALDTAAAVDWSKLSPDAPVPVVNRFTGKRLSGTSAPQLKNLAQWLLENPMFDVDPHWSAPKSSGSGGKSERRKGPGRPPMSPPSAGASSSRASQPNKQHDSKHPLYGMDPKNLLYGMDPKMMAAYGMDPRLLQMDPKLMASMGLDPKLMASMGLDPKMMASMGLDPKMMASMGLDPKVMASMGLDPKMMASMGLDPKVMASMGLDSKSMAAMGLDPKVMTSLGLDPKMMASMGMDPKTMASMGLDPKMMAAMGVDPKMMASMGLDPKMMASMGLDPKMMASMGLDPKVLASMGLDPKMMSALGMDPKTLSSMGVDPKMMAAMGLDPKAMASMGIDPKYMNAMGLDPKAMASAMGLDQKTLAAMGLDQKTMTSMGLDPKNMASMGLDPKNMASMGLDPKNMASMGLDPKILSSMGLDPKLMQSMGIDPKALAAMSDPKMLAAMGLDPKMMASLGMDPKMMASLGMDSKMMASMGMDPKSLAAMGLDPKSLALMSGLDPKMNPLAGSSIDPKALSQLDPKMLSNLGMDPKTLSMMGGMDPRLLAMDPRTSAALAGLDPKMLAQMDPALLCSLGIDPKLLQALTSSSAAASSGGRASTTSTSPARSTSSKSKSSSSTHRTLSTSSSATAAASSSSAASVTSSAAAAAISSSAAGLYGLDPALLQGLDPRALAAMDPRANPFMLGLDPKTNPYLAAGLDPKHNPFLAGLDPKHPLYGIDPKMLGIDMKSPLMYGGMTLPGMYPGLSLPGLTSAGTTSSLAAAVSSSSRKHAAASSPVSLYGAPTSSMYGAAASGYSPMAGWGGAALYNGGGTATVSSTRTKPTASSTVTSDEVAGGGSDRRAAEREKIRSLLKDKVDIKGGLTKEQRNLLKERKRERLMKEQDGVDLRGAREQLEAAERLAREMEREQRTRDRELDAKERQLAEAQAALLAETAAAGSEEAASRQPLDLPPAAVEATSERPASVTPPAVSEPPPPPVAVDHEPSTA